jgi:hypothetical protein
MACQSLIEGQPCEKGWFFLLHRFGRYRCLCFLCLTSVSDSNRGSSPPSRRLRCPSRWFASISQSTLAAALWRLFCASNQSPVPLPSQTRQCWHRLYRQRQGPAAASLADMAVSVFEVQRGGDARSARPAALKTAVHAAPARICPGLEGQEWRASRVCAADAAPWSLVVLARELPSTVSRGPLLSPILQLPFLLSRLPPPLVGISFQHRGRHREPLR